MTETQETQDPVADALAELNGDAPGMPPFVGAPPIAAPSRADELRVTKASVPLPPVRRADVAHATKSGGKGYRVRVVGLYYANATDGPGKVKKPYDVEINVPQLEGAKSTIKNRLLTPALKRKYPDAVRHRTLHIASYEPLSPEMPAADNLDMMTRSQLESYARSAKVPVDVATFPRSDAGTAQLRAGLIDHRQNPEGFTDREKIRREQRAADAELLELNPDLAVGGADAALD